MASSSYPTVEGKADFRVGDEVFQTWYKVVGDLKGGKRPLVALHGGPGICHIYLSPLTDLVSKNNIPVVFYDQVGGGYSTFLPDKPKEFWTPELFMDELKNLLDHLGIASDYDVLGHSWGGMLGAQFAAQRPEVAKGMKRLIIADSPASMPLWEKATGKLLKGMPQDIQDVLKKHEDDGTTDSEEYQGAVMVFYAKHLCRTNPMPEDLQKSFEMLQKYPVVYNTMCVHFPTLASCLSLALITNYRNGPSEFHVIGTLKHWSIIDDLHKIKQSCLIINAIYDEAQDVCVAPFFNLIPKAKWITFADSAHMPQWDERDKYVQVVGDFLTLTN